MPETKLENILYFYNHKGYPSSLSIMGGRVLLQPQERAVREDGSYIVSDDLFAYAKKGFISYKLKTPMDEMIKDVDPSDESKAGSQEIPVSVSEPADESDETKIEEVKEDSEESSSETVVSKPKKKITRKS